MSELIRAWVRTDGARCRIVANPRRHEAGEDTISIHVGSSSVYLTKSDLLKVARDLEGKAWERLGELEQSRDDARAWPVKR